jgi:hypothetical protein
MLIPLAPQQILMINDDTLDGAQLRGAKAAGLVQADRVEPELRAAAFALDMNVARFRAIIRPEVNDYRLEAGSLSLAPAQATESRSRRPGRSAG